MKQIGSVIGSALFVVIVFLSVMFASCRKRTISYNDSTLIRPCDNVICLNGGTCNDGQCYCAEGYEGIKCATRWNEKFVGTYVASDECKPDSTAFYNVQIVPDLLSANKMQLINLGTFCQGAPLQAIITPEKTSFIIPLQFACGDQYISGSGNINNTYINIFLQSRDSMLHTTSSCSIVMNK